MRRFAAIDIGSNALRMRVVGYTGGARGHTGATWVPLVRERVALRLGHDVFVHGAIGPKAMDLACEALKRFGRAMASIHVDGYRAVATSALRDAANGSLLVSRIARATGIRLEVIDGQEEAELIALAVAREVPLQSGRVVLVDLGGGSVEVTLLEAGTMMATWSLPLGTVRLLENTSWTTDGSFDADQRTLLEAHIDRLLRPVVGALRKPISRVLVTGGNARALAALCPAKDCRVPCIDVKRMRRLFSQLAPIAPSRRSETLRIRSDRADVIVPAIAVFATVAKHLGVAAMYAPGAGLSEGVLHTLIDDSLARPGRASELGTGMSGFGGRLGRAASYIRYGTNSSPTQACV